MKIYPIILSGGSGTRLWPLSRSMYPKQFAEVIPERDNMLSETAKRLSGEGFAAPTVVCNSDHRFLARDALQGIGIEPRAIVLEPMPRNTAPAIAAAAYHVHCEDPDGVLAVMPSDHIISDPVRFREAIERAADCAAEGHLVLFGITPTNPNTGYGYIQSGDGLAGAPGIFDVAKFVEKPDEATAQKYLDSGDFAWNSGIFVLPVAGFLEELKAFEPKIAAAAQDAVTKAKTELGFTRLDGDAFGEAPSISVDYAVMEQTRKAAVMPLDIGWNDVGSWAALWEVVDKDDNGNACVGDVMPIESEGNYVRSESGLVATIGVKDLTVVQTRDATLIAPKSRSQDVGQLVGLLKAAGRTEHEQHVKNTRPWGFFETLAIGPRFQVKRLHVNPGGKLSMQMHHHRSEHWVVVQGTAMVTVGDIDKLLTENESVYIFATQWHRLENPGKVPLEIIEVQIGSYLGEDDILRSDDIYNRDANETK